MSVTTPSDKIILTNLHNTDSWSLYNHIQGCKRCRSSTAGLCNVDVLSPSVLSSVERTIQIAKERNQRQGISESQTLTNETKQVAMNNTKLKMKKRMKQINAAVYDATRDGLKDTKLKLKWTRLHPITFFQASEQLYEFSERNDISSNAAIQSSSIIDQYLKVQHDLKRGMDTKNDTTRMDNSVSPHDTNYIPQKLTFLQLPHVKVNLTYLLDPPLHSEWMPGLVTSATDESDDISDASSYDDVENGENLVDSTRQTLESALDALIYRGVRNYFSHSCNEKSQSVNCIYDCDSCGAKDCENSCTLKHLNREIIQSLKRLSTVSWLHCLPSQIFRQKVKFHYPKDLNIRQDETMLGLSVLTVLARGCSSESLGRHILNNLAPLIFSYPPSDNGLITDTKERDSIMRKNQTDIVKKLANVLVHKCKLGNLTKEELRKLTQGLGGSHFANQFSCCLANAFYNYWRIT